MAKEQPTTFSNLATDASRKPIQVGSAFQTLDATGTPKTSPLAYTDSTQTIAVPDRAIEFIVNPSTALRISEQSDMTPYDVIAANTKESIPCAKMTSIYIVRDSQNGTLNFRFTLV